MTTILSTGTQEAEIFFIVTVCTIFDFRSQSKDSPDATSLLNVLKILEGHTDWPQESTLNDVAIESDFVEESGKACGEVDFTFTGKHETFSTKVVDDALFSNIASLLKLALGAKIEIIASEGDGTVLPKDLALNDDDFSEADILNPNEEPVFVTETVVELEYSHTYEPDEIIECDNPADIDLEDSGLTDADKESLRCAAANSDDSNDVFGEDFSGILDDIDLEIFNSIEEEPIFVQGSDPISSESPITFREVVSTAGETEFFESTQTSTAASTEEPITQDQTTSLSTVITSTIFSRS